MPLHKLLILASDSAVVYRNEHFIGEALKTLLPKHNLQRKDVFITTKLSEFFHFSFSSVFGSRNFNEFPDQIILLGGQNRQ